MSARPLLNVAKLKDSFTRPGFSPGKPFLNRGIGDRTRRQMLVRFRQDAISLRPRVVVIHAGANDLASIVGRFTEGTMADNIMSIMQLAKIHGPQGKIIGLNHWIKDYAPLAEQAIAQAVAGK